MGASSVEKKKKDGHMWGEKHIPIYVTGREEDALMLGTAIISLSRGVRLESTEESS